MRASTLFFAISSVAAMAQSPINGPMPGYSECLESIIWLQCHGPCTASIEYWKDDRPDSLLHSQQITATEANAYAMDFVLDKVVPGTRYGYRVLMYGKPVDVGEPLFFHTQPLWRWRGDPPEFSLATGSCAYINEAAHDRPGKPYGGEYRIFNSMADQHPDLMLWLGDNVYLREPDWGSWSGIVHRYTHARSLPEMQRFLHSAHHYAIWDDHDFGPNDADGNFPNANLTTRAFDLFWPNPPGQPLGVGGITNAFTYADVDVFMLDDRSFRVPPSIVTEKPTMLGQAQIDWLIRSLKTSNATFKLVALGSQFLNTAAVYETYATFPEERQQLIDRIDKEGIKNVVFVTGDRHFTQLAKLDLPGGGVLYDLTVSPLTSSVHPQKEMNALAVEGTYVEQRNFALMKFSGPVKGRQLTLSVHDVEGKTLWERNITAQ